MAIFDVASIAPHWAALRSWLEVDSEAAYDRATARLQQLLDEVGSDERHPCRPAAVRQGVAQVERLRGASGAPAHSLGRN